MKQGNSASVCRSRRISAVAVGICVCVQLPARANDSAAAIAVGGIQLKREARISMQKERLTIGEKKIIVEYEFLNDTDEDISTEVAFPIPPYTFYFDDNPGVRGFDTFRVWVEGTETKYAVEVKATHNGVDYTRTLMNLGVDIASFAHFDPMDPKLEKSELTALAPEAQVSLIRNGLMDVETKFPGWTVEKTYHWPQTFPSHTVLHVLHEYRPVEGYEQMRLQDLEPRVLRQKIAGAHDRVRQHPEDQFALWDLSLLKPFEGSCIDSSMHNRLALDASNEQGTNKEGPETAFVFTSWIQYVLTTANSWKTPIKDFELIVERPISPAGWSAHVSFCWDGPVERIDENHFSARVANFVPRKDLVVFFLEIAGKRRDGS